MKNRNNLYMYVFVITAASDLLKKLFGAVGESTSVLEPSIDIEESKYLKADSVQQHRPLISKRHPELFIIHFFFFWSAHPKFSGHGIRSMISCSLPHYATLSL